MRFLLVAILFVLAVAAFTAVTKLGYLGSLEQELSQRAHSALNESGFDGVEVGFDHHNVILSGYVDHAEDKARVLELVKEAVPVAITPLPEEVEISIRPTLPPLFHLIRELGEGQVELSGEFGTNSDANRSLLGSRILSIEGVESVQNDMRINPERIPFQKTAELASLAEGLLRHSDEVTISLKEGKLSMTGEVPNDGLKQGLLELAALIGAQTTKDEVTVREAISLKKPSFFSITRNRFGIIVSGEMGSNERKTQLLALFDEGTQESIITDRIEIDEELDVGTAEMNAKSIVPLLLETLKGEMTADFSADRVRLTGNVRKEGDKQKIIRSLSPLKAVTVPPDILIDLSVKEQSADGPPVKLLAVYTPEKLIITGNVPDASFVSQLEALLEASSSELTVESKVAETPNSPGSEWVVQLSDLFYELDGRVEAAVIRISENAISLEGKTLEPADRQLLHNVAINIVPGEFTVTNRLEQKIDEPPPLPKLLPEERTKLSEQLKQLPIYFGSNSEIVSGDEQEKVNQISELIKAAEVPITIKVTGFSDNVGNAEYNRELSLRRANSVLSILTSLEIPKDSMSTESVGEDVSNVSRSLRWKSRRVEVSLVSPSNEGAAEPTSDN